ncbi:MAG: HAMP domain-containing protein [Deltaproteobacteria bacterium]|nr:HAMP domain-containing protein [Deltaproteobacteria bacterium]
MPTKSTKPQGKGISIRWLLLGVNGLVLLMPVLAVFGLKLYQNHLVHQTETNLIGQSVVIAEVWRAELRRLEGQAPDDPSTVLPPHAADDHFAPIDPVIDLAEDFGAPVPDPTRFAVQMDGLEWQAGEAIQPLLARAKVFNLMSARVFDKHGCIVASSGTWLGACLDGVAELDAALDGRYAASARERYSDEPKPSFASISRRGDVRVFTALPIFADGEVIGAVWMSRTSMAPLKAAWLNRRPLTIGVLATVLLTALISLFLARTITRPVQRITAAAEAVARGERRRDLAPKGFAPSEVRALARALETMKAGLSDRAEYVADFAANVSHELKSPITAIQGAAELLVDEAGEMPAEQRRRFLDNILGDAERMERLVTRLLELARIQSAPEGDDELRPASFLEQIAEGYGERVRVHAVSVPATVKINPDHLESAVRNLLDNAVRHVAGQPVDLVAFAADDGKLAIEVRDRGPGISEQVRERLFERFFTTERDRGGTGLGLAIVQAVAFTRGGDVKVDTGPDGTTFTLTV